MNGEFLISRSHLHKNHRRIQINEDEFSDLHSLFTVYSSPLKKEAARLGNLTAFAFKIKYLLSSRKIRLPFLKKCGDAFFEIIALA